MALRCPDDELPTPGPSMALHFSPAEVVRGNEATAILNRSPASELQVVVLSTATPGLVAMPASVTLQPGQSETSFQVATADESTAESVTITATTNGISATATLFLRDREDPVAPLRIESAVLDNDDVIGGDDVGVTVGFTRAVRDGDQAFLQLVGSRWWANRQISVVSGAQSIRFSFPTAEVDEVIDTQVGLTYQAATQGVDVPIRLLPVPRLSSISPAAAAQGNTVTVTLSGRHLTTGGGATVQVSGSGIAVTDVTRVDAHTLTATFAVDPLAPAGPRDVTVRNHHGTTRPVTFTVNEG